MLSNNKGFTLVELLLVVVIIGLGLAVIVPRAWRANIDTKYGLVRQNCSELASFAHEWSEGQLLAQNATTSTATADAYYTSLTQDTSPSAYTSTDGVWVADQSGTTNWGVSGAGGTVGNQGSTPGTIVIPGRFMDDAATAATAPETVVEGIIPPEKVIRNPFNEVSVFQSSNDPSTGGVPIPGAIACAVITDPDAAGLAWHYYAFLYQGTDSTDINFGGYGPDTGQTFYAGQDTVSVPGMRNGIFMARVRP